MSTNFVQVNTWLGVYLPLEVPVASVLSAVNSTSTVNVEYSGEDYDGIEYQLDDNSIVDIGNNNVVIITDLDASVTYNIKFRAYSLSGKGNWSSSIQINLSVNKLNYLSLLVKDVKYYKDSEYNSVTLTLGSELVWKE